MDNENCGGGLLFLASIITMQIAQNKSQHELAFLSALLSIISSNLVLLALLSPSDEIWENL